MRPNPFLLLVLALTWATIWLLCSCCFGDLALYHVLVDKLFCQFFACIIQHDVDKKSVLEKYGGDQYLEGG